MSQIINENSQKAKEDHSQGQKQFRNSQPAQLQPPFLALTERAVKYIVETQDVSEMKSLSFILQVINVKIFDTDNSEAKDQKKQVKARLTLSDGEATVLAMMNKQVWDKMESETIPKNSVIQIFTFSKQLI